MPPAIDFEALFNNSPNAYALLARDLTLVAVNDAYLQVTDRRREDIIGRNMFDAFPADPSSGDDSNVRRLRASFERVLAERRTDTLALIRYAIPHETPDGVVFEERFWSASHTPLFDDDGEVAYIFQHTVDVTELQSLKRALREAGPIDSGRLTPAQMEAGVFHRAMELQESNLTLDSERRQLRQLFEQAPAFICFLRGPTHVFELANDAYYQLVGRRDLIGRPIAEALPEVADQGFVKLLDRVYESGAAFVGRGTHIKLRRRPGGLLEDVYVDFVYQPVTEPDGSVSGIFVQGSDVTEQRRAEDELQRYRSQLEDLVLERTRALEESEAALRHAQKLEAVGRLTGGVAHDFNNLLQVIGGNLQLLRRDVGGDPAGRRRLDAAIQAVDRGAKLAAQLLAFARRQPLEPVAINFDTLLRSMDDLLRRALGESIDIRVNVADGLWNTFADPGQVENVILNLAINARDAMQGNGRLAIEASNVELGEYHADMHWDFEPGEYVLLSVSDTGCGMPPEVLEQAFEPFFTTKPEGQGTGLGLSMVYGFVKQSGGHVTLTSEVGKGTTIRIYLPRADAEEHQPPAEHGGPVEGGDETILVVEDDADVRATTVDLLSRLGYRVLEAADGKSAKAVIDAGEHIDLLFSDVVMPGPLHSTELVAYAKTVLPDLQVLFASGYTDDALIRDGRLEHGVSLLGKPYRHDDLARRVRHLLRNGQQLAVARQALERAERQRAEQQRDPRRRLRVLLVEDEEFIREALTELLDDSGHEIVAVGSAEQARELLAERPFDVLFTDVSLPGMSGTDLAAAALEQQPELRVVIASGYGRAAIDDTGLSNALFLPKPYDIAAVERVIGQIAESVEPLAGALPP